MLTCIFAKYCICTASDRPLRRPIQGHRKERRFMKILIKGRVETVSLDRVKPAHFECEPETGTATQRKTQPKTTNSKTTEIVRGIPKDQIKSSSTLTQKPDRTRVKSTTNKQSQSAATKIGRNLATTPQLLHYSTASSPNNSHLM